MGRSVKYQDSNKYWFDKVVLQDGNVRLVRSMRARKNGWFVFDDVRTRRYYSFTDSGIKAAMRDYLGCVRRELQNPDS